MTEWLMISSLLFISTTYFGYPLLLWLWICVKPSVGVLAPIIPPVTVLIAAYNEENCIGQTIASILASDYPEEALKVVVVSDASTDRTGEIVASFSPARVRLFRQPVRRGKVAALALGLTHAGGDFLVLCDASIRLRSDTVGKLVRHFADPRVGAVSGCKIIAETGSVVSQADGSYAKYDAFLRSLESRTGSSWVGCEGGIFAIRRALLTFDFPEDIAEDYAICCRVFERGSLHRFDPTAVAYERCSQDLKTEFVRKIRVVVRGIRGFFAFRHLLNPVAYPFFFIQNVFHRLFRWLVPFFLILLWMCSGAGHRSFDRALFYSQCLFYALAFVGIALRRHGRFRRIMLIPAYFTLVNLAGLLSWGLLFRKYNVWTPPLREHATAL